jgi:hypothetical protein
MYSVRQNAKFLLSLVLNEVLCFKRLISFLSLFVVITLHCSKLEGHLDLYWIFKNTSEICCYKLATWVTEPHNFKSVAHCSSLRC